ncbi:MAG: hypothetical protein MUQ10_09245, partial [Anaerolineae bacterium]|nr:hypothetical protein [Anaerolineae bacterium]
MNTSRKPRTASVELVAWALVLGVAASLRLVSLGAAPLRLSEAREALAALQASQTLPTAGTY